MAIRFVCMLFFLSLFQIFMHSFSVAFHTFCVILIARYRHPFTLCLVCIYKLHLVSIPLLLECNIDCHSQLQKVKKQICIAQMNCLFLFSHVWWWCAVHKTKGKKLISIVCTITQSTNISPKLLVCTSKNTIQWWQYNKRQPNDNESAMAKCMKFESFMKKLDWKKKIQNDNPDESNQG